jgi:hypothetical protein
MRNKWGGRRYQFWTGPKYDDKDRKDKLRAG